MTRPLSLGSEAFARLQQYVSRRAVLRAGAKGAAGLGLAALSGQMSGPRTRAAQDAVCGGEEITITYGFWDAAQQPAVEQQIAAFKELRPNITVEPQVVPWDDYWTKLQTGVAGGATNDVFWMNADGLPVYASQGALAPIQDLIDDGSIDASPYPESLRSIYTFDGTAYGIPRDFDTIALFYNKDHFDAAGLEYPTGDWNWDDLRAAAEQLTIKEGETASQWGYASALSGQQNVYNLIWQNEGQLLNEDQTESRLGEPAACEALQFAGDFIADGLSPSVAVMQANDPHEMLFPAGVVSMIFGGSWNALTFSQANPAIALAPLPQGKVRASAIHGLANVIWSGGQNQCAALEWVTFLASPEAERILGETGTVIPAMEGMQEAWAASLPTLDLQIFLDAVDYSVPLPNPLAGPEWENDVIEVLVEAWSGGIPREEVCERANEAANAALSA
ncbi:MAG: ABC transporter substrate-binding protein [Thermomicrobiales bacterium]